MFWKVFRRRISRGLAESVGASVHANGGDALGEPIDYPDDSYDAVAVCGVFTPNHAPASGLDELIRVTRPGGLLLFTALTHYALFQLLFPALALEFLHFLAQRRIFTPQGVEHLVDFRVGIRSRTHWQQQGQKLLLLVL